MEFPTVLPEAPTEIHRVASVEETSQSLDETTRIPTNPDAHPIRAEAGLVLRNRYRLEELLVRREETQTWLAFDEMLARPVRVHLMPPDRPNRALLAAARRAAVASDYRFLRVLDATIPKRSDGADSGIGPYIVCEYAAGQTLQELLAAGPLSALEAAWLVREVADALIAMHAQKLYHQRLSPTTVVVTTDGAVKIVGFLLEAEMSPSHQKVRDPEAADVQALGRLLYSTLTGRWLGGQEDGMAEPPTDSAGRILTPQQIDSSVSPSLDQVCDRILNPKEHDAPLRTAAEVSTALSRVLGTADATLDLEKRVHRPAHRAAETLAHRLPSAGLETAAWPATSTPPKAPAPRRATAAKKTTAAKKPTAPKKTVAPRKRSTARSSRWVRVLVALVPLAVVGILITGAVRLNPSAETPPNASTTQGTQETQETQAAAGPSERLPVVAAEDFDPEGNGEERPREVARAWDDNPATSWRTMNYWEAEIGNKSGVGLIFDLGEVRELNRVELDLDGNGTSLDVRIPAAGADNSGQPAPNSAAEWSVVSQAQRTPSATSITLDEPVKTRFVLIYLTELPSVGSEFTGGIAEARFWS